MKTLMYIIALSAIIFVSCNNEAIVPTEMVNQDPISATDTLGKGVFTGYAHDLMGKAILFTDSTGAKTLRLENFNMTPGPDVHVYLSKTTSYSASNVIEVTKFMSGYTNSSINLPVTQANYTSDHKYVLVYCVQYSTLFGFAGLQ